MAFRVFPANLGSFRADSVEILASGVLRVRVEGMTRYFSPAHWVSVEATGVHGGEADSIAQ
jgi:hypothetical protein